MIELTQRVAGVVAFEIVLGPEQALAAGLAPATRNRAQRVEPTGDGREKAPFRLYVCRDGAKQGRLRLVGAVGATQALNGGVRLPARLDQIMHTQATVPGRQFGVVAAAGPASVRENEDALDVIHERRGLGEVRRASSVINRQPIILTDNAARATGNLGDHVRAEPLNDLVERTRHGWQRGEFFDQSVTARNGFTAFDRLAVTVDGPRTEIALGIRERLVELHREGMGEIVEHVLARGDVDLDVAPILGLNLREPTLHESLAGRDDLDHGGVARAEIVLDRADQRGRLHRGQEVAEEALLGALEGGTRGGLGLRVERTGLAGDIRRPHGRIKVVVDDRERAGIGVVDADLV